MMRKVNAPVILNELKIRKVAPAICLNDLILNDSKADLKIFETLFPMYRAFIGRKSVRSTVDFDLINNAGMMANREQGIATQTDKSLTPCAAPSGNHFGSYRITQNQGAITQCHLHI